MSKAWLLLPILLISGPSGFGAEPSLPVQTGVVQSPRIPLGPLGTCRLYIQGRYSACEVTTEPVCQKLSEVWHKPRYAIVLRRWYALPEGLAWDMPPC